MERITYQYRGEEMSAEAVPRIRSVYDGFRTRVVCHTSGAPDMAKGWFKDECDINRIMARARRDRMVPTHLMRGQPRFMDVSEVGDYRSALEHLRRTDEYFRALPAKVREAFDNDPAIFLDAMDSPEGRERLVKAGLMEAPPKAEEPVPPPA